MNFTIVSPEQVANYVSRDIDIRELDDIIDVALKIYLTSQNVGKYILYRYDSGEAQTYDYYGRQIIESDAGCILFEDAELLITIYE